MHAHLVMEVVGPHTVEPPATVLGGLHQLREVAMIFGDKDHRAPGMGPHRCRELLEEVTRTLILKRVRGIETEAIEMVLPQPLERVRHEEVAHFCAVRAVEVYTVAPWTVVPVCKVVRAERVRVGAVGAKVVVDDVEKHRQAMLVRGVRQAP
jgi:hypothetical protein